MSESTLPELILEDLRWKADQAIINYEGESVWLKQMPGYITDCCLTDSPCERHRAKESTMTAITAVVRAYKIPQSDDTATINFSPDYQSEENKAWAKYTPALNFSMHVLKEVADKIENGQAYLVTFEPRVTETP